MTKPTRAQKEFRNQLLDIIADTYYDEGISAKAILDLLVQHKKLDAVRDRGLTFYSVPQRHEHDWRWAGIDRVDRVVDGADTHHYIIVFECGPEGHIGDCKSVSYAEVPELPKIDNWALWWNQNSARIHERRPTKPSSIKITEVE